MGTNDLSANFALDFDISDFNLKLWVREDYALLYDHCTAYFNRWKTGSFFKAPSVVITGQPGIGK